MAFTNEDVQEIKEIVLETIEEESDPIEEVQQVSELSDGDEVPIVRSSQGVNSYRRAPVNLFGGGGSVVIVNNLTTGGATKALSAEMGRVLKSMIPTSLSQLPDDNTHRTVTDSEKAKWNDKYTKTEVNNMISSAPESDVIVFEVPSGSDIATYLLNNVPAAQRSNNIFRVPGTNSFSEWAWNGTAFIQLDEKNYGVDNEPTRNSNNLVKSSGIYDGLKNSERYTGEVWKSLFDVTGGYYEDNASNNISKCTKTYYQANTIWGNKYHTRNNIASGIYWKIRKSDSLGVSIYKVNIDSKEKELVKTVAYNSNWNDGELLRIEFDEPVVLDGNEYIGIDAPIYFTDTLTDSTGKSFFLMGTTVGGGDNTAIGLYTYAYALGYFKPIEDKFNAISTKKDYDENIGNYENWNTSYYTPNIIFCPDESVNVGSIQGITWKCNKQAGETVKFYKVNITNGNSELIKTFFISNSCVDGTLVDIQLDGTVNVGANEAIGISGPLYYWDSHGGSYQISGTTVTHNVANIGISTFKATSFSIPERFDGIDEEILSIKKSLTVKEYSQNLERKDLWTTSHNVSGIVFCPDDLIGVGEINGVSWKCNKQVGETLNIYKFNISAETLVLIKSFVISDGYIDGNIIDLQFDEPVTINSGECVGVEGAIYYEDSSSHMSYQYIIANGNLTHNRADIGIGVFSVNDTTVPNRISGNIVAWYGTSIPAGEPHTNERDIYSYANIAVHRLGGTILNYCVSGSCLISKENTSSQIYPNIRFSDTTAPINYQNSMLDLIGTANEPEWFVFDFGANDGAFYKSQFDELDFDNLDFTSTDKKTFLGAYNLVIKSLLQAKPKAKIALVTHFSDDSVNGTHEDYYLNLNKLIRRIGEYWQIPVNDMSHKCGFMYRNGINTLNAYMPIDGLHPGNSLEVVHMLADIHYKFLLNL